MFMWFVKWSSVINLDLFWKKSFLILIKRDSTVQTDKITEFIGINIGFENLA
jgi:hypothetical protein